MGKEGCMSKFGWVRHLATYGGGVIMLNALSFLLLPLYTRCISPSDFGVLELLNRSSDILRIALALGVGNSALMFYQFERHNPRKQRRVFPTAITGLFILGAALVLGLQLFSSRLAQIFLANASLGWAVTIFLWCALLELIFQVGLTCLQAQIESLTYTAITISRVLFALLVNLVALLLLHAGLRGAVLALLAHTLLFAFVVSFLLFRSQGFGLDWKLWKSMLKFGLPFVPSGAFIFVLNNGDRYFIQRYSGSYAVGIYALSYKLGMLVSVLVLGPFLKYWSAVMYETATAADGATKLGKTATYLCLAYTAFALPVSVLAPELIHAISGSAFAGAAPIVPWICLSYLFWSLSTVLDTAFYVTKKTAYKPALAGGGAAICTAFYYVLIPRYGNMGAALATLFGFASFFALTWIVSRRIIPIRLEWGRMLTILCVAIALYAAAALASGITHIVLAVGVSLAFPLILVVGRFFHPAESELLRASAQHVWDRLSLLTSSSARLNPE